MAYSMFERPKLHNAKSLKFYPEEYDHHVSFRHKNLPPDFDLTPPKEGKRNYSIDAQTSTSTRKSPIYVHTFNKMLHENGDFVLKSEKHKRSKSKHKTAIEKLEESYWANWKPDKNTIKKIKSPQIPIVQDMVPEIQVIKSAPDRRRKIQVYPRESLSDRIQKNTSKSQEIQTDDVPPATPEKEDILGNNSAKEETNTVQENLENDNIQVVASEEATEQNKKFLNHTDSLILNIKKQKEEKEHFEQPKCIRLYRKPGKTTRNYTKGGSYPLKSCLKKDSNVTKGHTKLGRPRSPLIVSSSYSNKHKTHRR